MGQTGGCAGVGHLKGHSIRVVVKQKTAGWVSLMEDNNNGVIPRARSISARVLVFDESADQNKRPKFVKPETGLPKHAPVQPGE